MKTLDDLRAAGHDTALCTALDGTLQRYPTGWRWSDGKDAPELRDMMLQDIAPNFRCSGGMGEIPHNWRNKRYWANERVDVGAANAIQELIDAVGQRRSIYAEGLAEALDDHRATIRGWVVPIPQWDAAMRTGIVGCWWDKSDEPAILDRARRLGWSGWKT